MNVCVRFSFSFSLHQTFIHNISVCTAHTQHIHTHYVKCFMSSQDDRKNYDAFNQWQHIVSSCLSDDRVSPSLAMAYFYLNHSPFTDMHVVFFSFFNFNGNLWMEKSLICTNEGMISSLDAGWGWTCVTFVAFIWDCINIVIILLPSS